jgi:hypothetical protein
MSKKEETNEPSWHLNKNFTISNVLVIAGAIVAGFIAFNTLGFRVKSQAQNAVVYQQESTRRADAQQEILMSHERRLQEIRLQTAVIKTHQEQQTRDIKDIKGDVKSILTAVKK